MKHTSLVRLTAALTALLMLALPVLAQADFTVVNTVQIRTSADIYGATGTYTMSADRLYAVYASDGTQLSDGYRRISGKLDGLYFEVYNESGMNTTGMLDRDGKLIAPMEYNGIYVLTDRWVVAVKLEETSDVNAPYKDFDGNHYAVGAADVFYNGAKVGMLTSDEFSNQMYVKAYGDYLVVQQPNRNVLYFNSKFDITNQIDRASIYNEFEQNGSEVIHLPTGQRAFTSTCTLTPEEVDQTVWYFDGAFVDLYGNVLSSGMYYDGVYYDRSGWVIVTKDDKVGMVDLQGREVVAPVYAELGGGVNDNYFVGGYQLAQSAEDEMTFSYVNREGTVTATFTLDESYEYKNADCMYNYLFMVGEKDGECIVYTAEAGELPTRYDEVYTQKEGQPLLGVRKGEDWYLIDVNGREVLQGNNNLSVTSGEHILAYDYYNVYTLEDVQ